MHTPGQFRLLTLHYALYQLAVAMAIGFSGAYLLQSGLTLPQALVAYAALLGVRCVLRFLGLGLVRRLGYRSAIVAGAVLGGLQFWPILHASETWGLVLWLVVMAFAESLYWPVYHAAVAVTGVEGSRGRELGLRTAIGACVSVLGPLCGGLLMANAGPAVNFGIGALLMAASAIPIAFMRTIEAGPVPSQRESFRLPDRRAVVAFASDGWMASGWALGWPMVLFITLGERYDSFGFANAAAGLAGAATGLLCGRAIDRGARDAYLSIVSVALVCGFALRAASGWSPIAAAVANASGAAVMGVYAPVLMSHIYDAAKATGRAYQFHFGAEAGWDLGASLGCLAAALVVLATGAPSLAVTPGALGIVVFYALLRRRASSAIARTSARSASRGTIAAPDA